MSEFDKWNQLKKRINKNEARVFFHPREVWFMRMGKNVGFEQSGKGEEFERPVIVLKKFNKDIFIGVPLTSQDKKGKYYFEISPIKNRKNKAIISQIKLIDKKRLQEKIGIIPKGEFLELKKIITKMLLSDNDF